MDPDPDTDFYLNVDPDPESQTNADPCGIRILVRLYCKFTKSCLFERQETWFIS
jgi:hypothetical protein